MREDVPIINLGIDEKCETRVVRLPVWGLLLLVLFSSYGCCSPLTPRAINVDRYHVSPEILAATGTQIERGQPRPVIDTVGWVIGIPSKILLWDRRVDNHRISHETELALEEYLEFNDLRHVKVRLNQYRPLDDWYRLTQNRSVGWGWRYTVGAASVLGETLFPGRILGGDHFNPFTNTVHLYSDIPAIAWHEAAHAKDFARRRYPGTYGVAYLLPVVPLWHESIATNDVLAYAQDHADGASQREVYRILYPAYGTYVGNALGGIVPTYSSPLYLGSVLTGHGVGRWQASRVADTPKSERTLDIEPVKSFVD
jgi:hypothetical protein